MLRRCDEGRRLPGRGSKSLCSAERGIRRGGRPSRRIHGKQMREFGGDCSLNQHDGASAAENRRCKRNINSQLLIITFKLRSFSMYV